jgi:hypothetical protein
MKMKLIVITVASLLCVANQSVACDFHGANFGVFGGFSAPITQSAAPPREQTLEVHHKSKMTTETGREVKIDVDYVLPLQYKNIVVEFEPSSNVSLSGEKKISPKALKGTHALYFTAISAGQHEIVVNVKANKNGEPYYSERRILIDAF